MESSTWLRSARERSSAQHLGLGAGARQFERVGVLDHIRDRGGRQLVERAVPHVREHLGPGFGVGPDVALLEGDSLFEL